jgi:hypothetical protein
MWLGVNSTKAEGLTGYVKVGNIQDTEKASAFLDAGAYPME